MRCRHKNTADKFGECTYDEHGFIVYEVEYRECLDCGHWLPLGPSDEAPVAVEVRAAEIAQTFHESDWPFSSWNTTQDENLGWRFDDTAPHTRGYDAGYLARVIATHGEE